MQRRWPAIDRNKIRTTPARARRSKVRGAQAAKPHAPGAGMQAFLSGLPDVLGAADLRAAIAAAARAYKRRRVLLWGFGAHLIKCGLSPLMLDLMQRGLVSGLMMNGAGCVHDLELAMMGRTSEDVAPALNDGSFGMARETAAELNAAINAGQGAGIGMGLAVGRHILHGRFPHKGGSLLAAAARLEIPATVHAAIGTDIHHMHPGAEGAALGGTSYADFESAASMVAALSGGVYFNIGSAVILPEVFLKALALARNLGHKVEAITTVDLDFIRQYRPLTNVVQRPTQKGGRGISLTGHHEIMLPLIAAGLIEAVEAQSARAAKARAANKRAGGRRQ